MTLLKEKLFLEKTKKIKKLTIIILIIFAYYTASCQTKILEKKISVHCKEQKISEILKQISKNENIRFSYGQLNDLNKKKSIYFKNGKLKFVLSKLFYETNIRYISFSDQIILVENEKAPSKKVIKAYIVDEETNKPIPYATVMYANTGNGAIADFNGQVEFEFDKLKIDSLKFASLGYKPRKFSTEKISKKNVIKIKLAKDLIPIQNINIRASDYYEKTSGNNGIVCFGALYMDTNGQKVALYIKNKERKSGKIHKIYFKLSKKGNFDAPFRIRIFKPDSAGKPGKDILKEILVVKPDSKKSWFSVDVSVYDVKMPQEGLFVSMEGVFPNDFDFYFKDKDFEDLSPDETHEDLTDLSYGQRLCYNKKGKNNTWHYSLSHKWFQLKKQRFNVMIRAKIIYKK